MATDKQIEANRRNARNCTGPKTVEGKLHSSQNALKTGLYAKSEVLVTESREAWEELVAAFDSEYSPATPLERCLVDALVRYEWLSRRYMAADTAAWNRRLNFAEDTGGIMLQDSQLLVRAARLFNTARRGFTQTVKQLEDLQARRKATATTPASAPQPEQTSPKQRPEPKLVSFRQGQILAPLEPELTQRTFEIPPLAA